jgi:hypothetical protein
MLHAGMSKAFDFPELELEKSEAKLLADGITTVAAQYTVEVNPRVVAWAGLCGILGTIYGTRIAAWRMRKMLEKKTGEKEPESHEPANVMAFDPSRFGGQ